MLLSFGNSKVKIIKEIRTQTGLGLKESKALVDSVPVAVKQAISKAEAESLMIALVAAGGAAELR